MSLADNPLLREHFPIDFCSVRAEHVRPAVDELLRRTRREQQALAEAAPTFDALLGGFDNLGRDLEFAVGIVGHLESVATTLQLRDAYNDVLADVSAFHTQVWLDPALWQAVRAYAASDAAAALSGPRRRYLEQVVRAFRRHGAELPPEGRMQLADLDRALDEATNRFSQAVLDATAAWTLDIADPTRLAGVPDAAKHMARAAAQAAGVAGWRLSLQQPLVMAVLTYAEDRALRRTVWQAYNNRAAGGEHDNRARIVEILRLRQAKARLLGYRDFVDYVLEERMAGSGAAAAAFVDDLTARTQAGFASENQELTDFYHSQAGADAPPLMPWDTAFWSERLKRARYALDAEALRPYFELDRVLAGLFTIAERLFGVHVEPVPADSAEFPGAWHPDVRYYRVRTADGLLVGAFYADLFPRDNKRGGAWMNTLIVGGPTPQGFRPHVGLIAANASPSVAGRPSLLTHDEVETIFHEFGHLLHQLLSRVELRSQAGTNVAWDFVELPSQIMENWCWERQSLDLFARHIDTDAMLDDNTFLRMQASRTFRGANAMMRQLGFAALDLALHREFDPSGTDDVLHYARRMVQPFSPVPLPDDYAMLTSFSHLFAGPVAYAGGYYSYKWSEVLEADAFSRFAAAGVFDAEVGQAFVETILAQGDSEDPAVLFRAFMGRDPSPTALLRRAGLV